MFFYLPAIYTDLLENQIHATKDPSPNKRCILLMKIKNIPAIILAKP